MIRGDDRAPLSCGAREADGWKKLDLFLLLLRNSKYPFVKPGTYFLLCDSGMISVTGFSTAIVVMCYSAVKELNQQY